MSALYHCPSLFESQGPSWRTCIRRDAPAVPGSAARVFRSPLLAGLFPVRHPNILDLHGVVEEPVALTLLSVEPVDGPAFVGKHLL